MSGERVVSERGVRGNRVVREREGEREVIEWIARVERQGRKRESSGERE